jgi:phage terminase large subunit-like protein
MKYIRAFHKLMDKFPARFGKEMQNTRKRVEEFTEKYEHKSKLVDFIINWEEKNCKVDVNGIKKHVKLTPFQKYERSVVFGFYGKFKTFAPDAEGNLVEKEEFRRVVQDVFVMIGTGGGKSTNLSCMATSLQELCYLGKPDMYIGSCAYSISTNLIKKIQQMLQLGDVENAYRFNVRSSGAIENATEGALIKAMSREGDNFEGVEMACLIIDEVQLFKTGEYINNLKKNRSKRPNMLTYEITTNGFERGGYLDKRLEYLRDINCGSIKNDNVMSFIFENESEEEVIQAYYDKDFDVFYKSNPNAGYCQSLDSIINAVEEMINDQSKEGVVFTKHFNIPQTRQSIYFTANECLSRDFDEAVLYNKPCFIGLDVAWTAHYTSDLTALTFRVHDLKNDKYFHKDYFFLPKHFKNNNDEYEDMIKLKSDYDGVDYKYFIERGDVILIDHHKVTEDFLIEFMKKIVEKYGFRPQKFGVDPNKALTIMQEFNKNMADKKFCLEYRAEQKARNTPAIEQVKSLRNDGKVFTNNKLTEMHFAQTSAKIDNYGGIILESVSPDRTDMVIAHVASERAEFMFNLTTEKGNQLTNYELLIEWWNKNG